MLLNKIDVSVIICCYNSEKRIVPTLEHLSKQTLGLLCFEIILVDNNCSDLTAETAIKVWEALGTPFELRIVKESQPGLSFARKCGVFSARGEIIVFCDDDNWLNEEYCFLSHEIMLENNHIGVLAGQSRAEADIEIPTWFYTNYGNYACGVLATQSGDVTSRLWVWGAGMVVRKNLMEKLYFKYIHTTKDRTKDSMESGGDVEICYWHILENKILWYDDRLRLKHYMPSSRLVVENALIQYKAQEESAMKMRELSLYTSRYLEYKKGMLTFQGIILDLMKLRMRSSLISIKYYIKFKLREFQE